MTKFTLPPPPEPFASIEELVMDMDRLFFEENPQEASYIRHYIPGEFFPGDWNISPACNTVSALIEVRQIVPGVRGRIMLFELWKLAKRRESERLAPEVEAECLRQQALMEEHVVPYSGNLH